jgi:hypothetical protein
MIDLRKCSDEQLVEFFYLLITKPGDISIIDQEEFDRLNTEELRRERERNQA